MATSFPTGLDALTNPVSTDTLASPSHADQHANVNDAIEALEAKVGVNSSAVTSSLDYKIVNIPASSITTGTLDNARLPAAATTITSVGTLSSLAVTGDLTVDTTTLKVDSTNNRVGIGTASPTSMLQVVNTTAADKAFVVKGAASQSGDLFDIQNSGGTSQFKVDSAGTLQAVTGVLELGVGRASSGFAYVDLVGDTTYTDYGLRLLRGDGGANTFSRLIHRGTGQFEITTEDAAPLLFYTNNTERMRINSSGNVGIGWSGGTITTAFGSTTQKLQAILAGSAGPQIIAGTYSADAFAPRFDFVKSRNATANTQTIVVSNDSLMDIYASGSDGTGMIPAARIAAQVDGTPGTNDMPGRLIFSTTADGASSVTERMRIDSSGNVGIGTTTPSSYGLLAVGASISASATTNMIGMYQSAGVDSATMRIAGYAYTGNARTAIDFVQNGATNFNSQMVFSTSAGADAVERMRITGGGNVGIGVTPTSMLHVVNTTAANKALVVKGAASQSGSLFEIQNSASTALVTVDSSGNVGIGTASPFSSAGYGALTVEGTGGHIISGKIAGTETFRLQTTTLSTTINVIAAVPLILNTSNTERMRITSAGNIGIGNSGGGDTNLSIGSNITGATTAYGIRSLQTIQSGVTGTALIFQSQPSTVASAFTLSSLHHFTASGVTVGAGSVVTEQNAFLVESTMTGATNNYGFRGSIASGTGRYNIYMGGTAQNYLAGNTGIGVTVPTSKLHVVGSFSRGAPVTKTGSFTLADTENWVICNGTASITVTLPAASTQVGREISLKNIAAFTVVSATANVVPLTGGAAGTAILAATAGTWAKLVSDGANWQIMQS